MQDAHLQISPLARAYLAAVWAGEITEDSPERQLEDAALLIVQDRVPGVSAGFLRVMAALCEVAAELKKEGTKNDRIEQQTSRRPAAAAEENAELVY